jgi:hypothetical protein
VQGVKPERRADKAGACVTRERGTEMRVVVVGLLVAGSAVLAAGAGDSTAASVFTGPLLSLRGWPLRWDELPAEDDVDRVTVQAQLPAGAGEEDVAAALMVTSALAEDILARMVAERELELESVLGRGRRPCHRQRQHQQQMLLLHAARADQLPGLEPEVAQEHGAQAQAEGRPAQGDEEAFVYRLSVGASLGEMQWHSVVVHVALSVLFILLACTFLGIWLYLSHVSAAAKREADKACAWQGSARAGPSGPACRWWALGRAAEGEVATKGDNELPLLAGTVI